MNYIDPAPKDSVKSRGFSSENAQNPNVKKKSNCDADLAELNDSVAPLTRVEMERLLGGALLKPSRVTVKHLLILQAVVTIASGLVWSVIGKSFSLDFAPISSILGGLAALLPAALFAARARFLSGRANAANSTVFTLVTGELLKIIATIAIFILVIVFFPGLDWLPLLLTYVITLKCYLFALFFR